jgi:hypothetical protein
MWRLADRQNMLLIGLKTIFGQELKLAAQALKFHSVVTVFKISMGKDGDGD